MSAGKADFVMTKTTKNRLLGWVLQLEPNFRFRLRLGSSLQNDQALGSQGQGFCQVGYWLMSHSVNRTRFILSEYT